MLCTSNTIFFVCDFWNVFTHLVIWSISQLPETYYTNPRVCSKILNWWKGKPSGSIACMRKQQPRFYWSCLSVVMNDATPLTPLAHEQNSIFKCKQHKCTLHDPWGPEKYDYTMMYIYICCLYIFNELHLVKEMFSVQPDSRLLNTGMT